MGNKLTVATVIFGIAAIQCSSEQRMRHGVLTTRAELEANWSYNL